MQCYGMRLFEWLSNIVDWKKNGKEVWQTPALDISWSGKTHKLLADALLYLEITGRFSIYDFGQWLPELVSHKLGSSWCCTTTITRSLVVHCALLYRSICQWLLNSWAWVKTGSTTWPFAASIATFLRTLWRGMQGQAFSGLAKKKVLNKQPLLVISKKFSFKQLMSWIKNWRFLTFLFLSRTFKDSTLKAKVMVLDLFSTFGKKRKSRQ